MRQGIALATSIFTLYGMWLAGNKRWQGWAVGLGNQALWLVFIVAFEAWGLLPLSLALIVTYTRNLLRWRREERHEKCGADDEREVCELATELLMVRAGEIA